MGGAARTVVFLAAALTTACDHLLSLRDDDSRDKKAIATSTPPPPTPQPATAEPKNAPDQNRGSSAPEPVALVKERVGDVSVQRPATLASVSCAGSAQEQEISEIAVPKDPMHLAECFREGDVELVVVSESFVATLQQLPLEDAFARRSQAYPAIKRTVTMKKQQSGEAFVVSGLRDKRIYYEKHVYRHGEAGAFGPNTQGIDHAAFVLLYPESKRAAFDDVVGKMAASVAIASKARRVDAGSAKPPLMP